MKTRLPQEGTFHLDGMLQGKLAAGDEIAARQRLNEWVAAAAKNGFHFSVEFDGPQFSLLCDNQVRPIPFAGIVISETLAQSLNGLLETFPTESRRHFFSTVRSVEYETNAEIQGVYPVGVDGLINPQERRVEIETTTPEAAMSFKQRLVMALISVLVILVFLAISAAFVDYGTLFGGVRDRVSVLKVEDIEFDTSAYARYVEITPESLDRKRGGLVLSLKRGEAWAALESSEVPRNGPSDGILWDDLLVLSNLKRGYLPCVLYNAKGEPVAEARLSLAPIAGSSEGKGFLPLTYRSRVDRIVAVK